MARRVNCRADFVFQVDLQVPALSTGILGPPVLGAVTGITARLSATDSGAALHATLDALPASERSAVAGRFYVDVEGSLLTSHVLPLGEDAEFFAIYSKANGFDLEAVRYLVADGRVLR